MGGVVLDGGEGGPEIGTGDRYRLAEGLDAARLGGGGGAGRYRCRTQGGCIVFGVHFLKFGGGGAE